MKQIVKIKGEVLLRYPRRWWEWPWIRFKGWHVHWDGYGTPCWIRFKWSKEMEPNTK